MAGKRKRKGDGKRLGIHPRNKYADNTPDFGLLGSLYPSFQPYVFYSRDGRTKIDWTDFSATRELTRVLLLHDHGLNWWIPDGQLCPTVPNRLNYIHWLEDLLASDIIPAAQADGDGIRGFDIGTGANCIYPLLGASILGWKFVGSDITDIAIDANANLWGKKRYNVPPVLFGVVKDGESFDFCMCNPPFFETMDEAGLNPKTSCGGTPEEMLRRTFRWYTSMVGRKYNLNILVSGIWNVGATVVKTTEFVQGRTSRWGLAWSFVPVSRKMIPSHNIEKNNLSFILEGLQRQHGAFNVLQLVESYLVNSGISCKLDAAAFTVDITTTKEQVDAILKNETRQRSGNETYLHEMDEPNSVLCFRISVFQQSPGALLVRGKVHEKASSIPGLFSLIFQHLEEVLTCTFSTGKVLANAPGSSSGR
ncbi:hypothetical protein OROGR_031640 [Orobanche gracilis]